MTIRAHLRFLRIAPRKVRLVIDLVRGLSVDQAIDQLSSMPKNAAHPVQKLIRSAMANAEHNFKLDPKDLYIKSIVANEGPVLKRYRPRAFGRAAEILKRTSHITVVLEDNAKSEPPTKTAAKPAAAPVVNPESIKRPAAQPKPEAQAKTTSKRPATTKPQRRSAEDKTIARKGKD